MHEISVDENKDAEKADDKTKIDKKKETAENPATKTSVKDEIKLRNSADKSDLSKQERPPSKTDTDQGTSLSKPDKEEAAVKTDSKSSNVQKSEAEVKTSDDKKGDSVKDEQTTEG